MGNSIGFVPLEDRILVKAIKSAEIEKTDGGIIIPDSAKRATCKAIVVAAGPGYTARDTGKFVHTELKEGNVILCMAENNKPIGLEIDLEDGSDNPTGYIMRETDVLMLISKKIN